MIPTLVGPILGPLIGGALSQAFGWRSCFVALAIAAVLALIAKLLVLRQVRVSGVQGALGLILLHLMICHSTKCHRPRTWVPAFASG